MRLTRHPSASILLQQAAELEEREAESSMLLGAALQLDAPPAYAATLRDRDGLAAAALFNPPFPLLIASPREDGSIPLDRLVLDLADTGARPTAVFAEDALADAFAEAWRRHGGGPTRVGMHQCLYALTRVQPVATPAGGLRTATTADVERIGGWMADFDREAFGAADPERALATAHRRVAAGEVVLWEDGEPVAMAASARPTRRTISVNAVYTPPERRGTGYATALVAQFTQRLLDQGRDRCLLFTDLANPTSNAIYVRIGYQPIRTFTLHRLLENPADPAPAPARLAEGAARE